MKRTSFILLLAILSFQCIHSEKASSKFNLLLNSHPNTSNIKMDGAYHHISKNSYHFPTDYKNGTPTRYIDSPYLDQPIFFFENGILLYEYRTSTLEAKDITFSDVEARKNFYTQKGWGVYNINHDTINAIIYVDFLTGWLYQGVAERLQCNFQGDIKNGNTISDWKLIPPIPNFNKKYEENNKLIELLQYGLDMYYKEVPEKETVTEKTIQKEDVAATQNTTHTHEAGGDGRIFISPLAKKMAEEKGIDIAALFGKSFPNSSVAAASN